MATRYKKTSLHPSGRAIYDAVVASTPALANAGLPLSGTNGMRPQDIGNFFYTQVELANWFAGALLNKIALSVVASKSFVDPWASLEKGKIDLGEVIEEVYIYMAKPKHFDQERAEKEVFKREFPNVTTAFHGLNYQEYYKITISREELRAAFLSWDRFRSFVADLIESIYTSANYDVYQVKKYLIARALLNGGIHMESIDPITDKDTASAAIAKARGVSNLLKEMTPNYNLFHVPNYANHEDQVIIIDSMKEGLIDVSVLAAAYHMDKAEFLQMHRLVTSGFGDLDNARLGEIFEHDPSYQPISDNEREQLNKIPFAIFDKSWFQIYDYLNVMESINNPEGLYINYNHHVWKYFGVSPFANATAFCEVPQEITSVEVSPSAVTISKGQSAQLTAIVTTTGFADKRVAWESSSTDVTVNANGVVTVGTNATATTAKITATSAADPKKSAEATVTIAT